MTHFYRTDYLEIAREFPVDDVGTVERMLEHYIPAMEEQAKRCDEAERAFLNVGRLDDALVWNSRAHRIRKHADIARKRLEEAGVDVPEKLEYHP